MGHFGGGHSSDRRSSSRALDLDGSSLSVVEAGAGLCELTSYHGREPTTAAAHCFIRFDGGRTGRWYCRPLSLSPCRGGSTNRVAGMFRESKLVNCDFQQTAGAD